ncbi:MAG: putative exported protein [Ramlibacter sp.]|nr:putative exported protein [Ramlibacter sp.]
MVDLGKRFHLRGVAAALMGFAGIAAQKSGLAQAFPSKPIRVVVGSPPGALGDILSRLIGGKLAERLGQSAVVENKPGAGLAIAADAVAKSVPDGHTIFLTPDSSMVANPYVYKRLPYDPAKEFRAVGLIGRATHLLLVNPSSGIKDMQQLIAQAKARPGTLNYGSPGIGHTNHLIMELIWNRLGVKLAHIPYKGTSDCVVALIAGDIQVTITGLVEALPLLKEGKIAVIAASGPLAKQSFPSAPLFRDFHKDLDVAAWFGMFVPKSTSNDTVSKLNAALNYSLERDDVKRQLLEFGVMGMPGTPEALDQLAHQDRQRWSPLIQQLAIQLD